MTAIHSFRDNGGNCFSNVRMDNDDPVFVSVAQTGVLVKRSRLGWFGPKLYQSRTVHDAAETAMALDSLYPEYVVPDGMTNASLRAFTNAVLHCSSTTDVVHVLNTAREKLAEERSANAFQVLADFLKDPEAERKGITPRMNLQATSDAVVRALGDVFVTVSETDVAKYPAGVYPESLLPISRPALEKLLRIKIGDSSGVEERQMLERSLALLDGFISDQQAYEQNAALRFVLDRSPLKE